MFQIKVDKFYFSEKYLGDAIKSLENKDSQISSIKNFPPDFKDKYIINSICDDLEALVFGVVGVQSKINSTKSFLSSRNMEFNVLYSSYESKYGKNYTSIKKENSAVDFLNFNVFQKDNYLEVYSDEQLDALLKSYGASGVYGSYSVSEYDCAQDMTFKRYLNAHEHTSVSDYLYGNAEYGNLVSKFITEDKQNFICYNDGLGKDDKNFGFGVLHYLGGKYQDEVVDAYKEVGIDIRSGKYDEVGVSQIPVDKVLYAQKVELGKKKNLVIDMIGADNFYKLPETQQNCLIDIAYQGCDSWGSLKKMLDDNVSSQYVVDNWPRLTSTTYNNQQRADARKKLWLDGIYTDYYGNEIK